MAILYVNANTGNNSNNGTTWALAKLTLAGVNTTATAGDTIYAHGIFVELLPVSKQLNWIGHGLCVFDQAGFTTAAPAANTTFTGIQFKGGTVACVSVTANVNFTSCEFSDALIGIKVGATTSGANVYDCKFIRCSTAGVQIAGNFSANILSTSVFGANGVDVQIASGSPGTLQMFRCVLGSPIMVDNAQGGSWFGASSDYNVFDFTNGKCRISAVDKTTIAAWRTSTGREANSIDRVWRNDVGDFANGSYRSPSGGYLLTAGPGGTPIGLLNKSYTISNNTHASSGWTSGGTFSNTTIDGSGNLVLVGAATSGTWTSAEIDFGVPVNILRIETQATGEVYPTTYIDTDTGDSPGFLNVEVYGSNSASGTPTFVAVPRRGEVANVTTNLYRYWTVRLTLRKP
jgi:hypothetical protein